VKGKIAMATQAASMKKRGARKRKTTAAIPYASKLGVNANNTLELIGEIEEGFSYQAFEELQDQLELSISELADLLQIPRRTLSRRKHEGKLPPDESERLLRFSRVLHTSLEIFEGNHEGALKWLRAKNRALGGETPLDMARTEIGAREVEKLIGRLEHGVFS
jgi:putative toxin-antitoxin system antitoxin component (TIGR02293 family)